MSEELHPTFDQFIGIDYSGAETRESRLKGLQVYASTGGAPERILAVPEEGKTHWNCSRQGVAEHLIELAQGGRRFIAGIDHGFGFPMTYLRRYGLASWDEFLDDFVQHWPTHALATYVDFIRDRRPPRTGRGNEFRLCERWTSSAKSVFKFDAQGQVAKSTHAGIPWLRHIRREVGDRVHFWPFDGWAIAEGKSVIAEVYPSILRNRYPKQDRSADEHDAYSVAQWLQETCERGFLGRYLDPPLTPKERQIAELEGWILGVA
jgi:uncharacterized short protein YbdD (DUF466 family)